MKKKISRIISLTDKHKNKCQKEYSMEIFEKDMFTSKLLQLKSKVKQPTISSNMATFTSITKCTLITKSRYFYKVIVFA